MSDKSINTLEIPNLQKGKNKGGSKLSIAKAIKLNALMHAVIVIFLAVTRIIPSKYFNHIEYKINIYNMSTQVRVFFRKFVLYQR